MNTHKRVREPIKILIVTDLKTKKVFKPQKPKKRNNAVVLAELSPGRVNL
jgi:hypothetical protein